PAATELIEQGVDGVAAGQVRFPGQADTLLGDDDAEALAVGEAFGGLAEPRRGQLADEDWQPFVARRRVSLDDLDLCSADAPQDGGKVLDRLAEAAAVVLRLQGAPYGGRFRVLDRIVHEPGRHADHRPRLAVRD